MKKENPVRALLFIALAAFAFSGQSKMQESNGVRYRNPIVFNRTHLDESGKVTLGSKLWVMEEDGSGLRQLTDGTTYDDHPSFYADQRHVLYSEFPVNALDRKAGARLVKLDIYTGQRETVLAVDGCALHHATISPISDDLIVYHRDCGSRLSQWHGLGGESYELNTVAINGVAVAKESVIFMHEKNRGVAPRQVALARIWGHGAGSKIVFLTDDKALNRRPAISPDGKWLAWQTNAAGAGDEIFLAEIDGAKPRNLTNAAGNDGHPWFSRDGKWIVFESDRTAKGYKGHGCEENRACEIWKLNIATGKVTQLTSGAGKYASTRPRM